MRRSSTLLLWCASSLLACANGDNSGSGPVSLDGSVPFSEGGLADGPGGGPTGDDSGATGPTGSTGGMPGVYDGGPPAMVGGVVDASAYGSGDAGDGGAVGPTDAGTDAGFDAASCGSPSGSYAQTCTNCSFTAPVLSCSCTTKSNTQNATTLNLCTCTQPPVISNNDGVLTCP